MRILMFTNTFTPHVGGVARSVEQFTEEYRKAGHDVLTVAPIFPDTPDNETDVIRIPAVQEFNGTDFSVPVPIPGMLWTELSKFQPEIIHTHHPFLLGDTALRVSARRDIPVVFTHHTQYEQYTHYVPGDSELMKRFVVDLAVGFCNLCDAVIAPSDTIKQRLTRLGVETDIHEIPTGVDTKLFGSGDGVALRERLEIDPSDFVVGHVGRLAPEKGLDFLAPAVARFVQAKPNARFLIAGTGDSADTIKSAFAAAEISDRLMMLGTLQRSELADVYAAMDVFVFASQSETQGMVLTEAMAAGTPVVAVDASGVREVMRPGENGIMIPVECEDDYVDALNSIYRMEPAERKRLIDGAVETAEEFSMPSTALRALELYRTLILKGRRGIHGQDVVTRARRRIAEEWKIWTNVATAASHAVANEGVGVE